MHMWDERQDLMYCNGWVHLPMWGSFSAFPFFFSALGQCPRLAPSPNITSERPNLCRNTFLSPPQKKSIFLMSRNVIMTGITFTIPLMDVNICWELDNIFKSPQSMLENCFLARWNYDWTLLQESPHLSLIQKHHWRVNHSDGDAISAHHFMVLFNEEVVGWHSEKEELLSRTLPNLPPHFICLQIIKKKKEQQTTNC